MAEKERPFLGIFKFLPVENSDDLFFVTKSFYDFLALRSELHPKCESEGCFATGNQRGKKKLGRAICSSHLIGRYRAYGPQRCRVY